MKSSPLSQLSLKLFAILILMTISFIASADEAYNTIDSSQTAQKIFNAESGLRNISTNGWVDSSGMQAGFIVEGDGPRRFAVTGEDMDGNFDAALVLTSLDGSTVYGNNHSWQDHPTAVELQTTLRQLGRPSDAGFVVELSPGAYIANLFPGDGRPGQGLVSVTEVSSGTGGGLRNISTNGLVNSTGILAGFIVEGGTRRFAVTGENQNNSLNAELSLHRLDGSIEISSNNDWQSNENLIGKEIELALRPLGRSSDAGLIVELSPGAYLARLYPENGSSGRGLISITDLDESDSFNSIEIIIDDMRLPHEGIPNGVPLEDGWALEPRISMGNQPNNYKALLAWGHLYEDTTGNHTINTRVQIRNIKGYYLSKSDGQWHLLQSSYDVDGRYFLESYAGNENIEADVRNEPDGSISVTAGNGYNFHFWTQVRNYRISQCDSTELSLTPRTCINSDDIAGIFTTFQARLILQDPSMPDDRDQARYIIGAGADYWIDLDTQWGGYCVNNCEIGIGRLKYVKKYWQSFNMITMPEIEIRSNPPPID